MLEKKRLHRFIKSLCCLTFKMFSQASCLAVAYVQPQPSPTRFKNVLLVFSRSKWSMKIQRGSQCIMFFKWEWCDLLLIDTKENANLCGFMWADVAFSTIKNYFRKLFEIFRDYVQACVGWNNHRKTFLERSWSKIFIKKGEDW